MAVTTRTITGVIKLPGAGGITGVFKVRPRAGVLKDSAGNVVFAGESVFATDAGGNVTITLPDTSQVVGGAAGYVMRFESTDRAVQVGWDGFTLTADATLASLTDVTDLPLTSSLVTRAEAAGDAAAASATAAQTSAASVAREQANGTAGLTSLGKLYESRIPDRLSDASLALAFRRKDPSVWDALDNGVKGDAIELTDVRITAGSAAIYAPGASFTSADVGKKIAVMGAGASGGGLGTSNNPIVSVTDGQNATMTVAATTTTSAPRTVTDAVMAADSQALTSATAAFTAGDIGKTVTIPGAGEAYRLILTDRGTVSGTTLSSPYAIFPATLAGQSVSIAGAGPSGTVLRTTVLSVAANLKSCVLADAASTAITDWAFGQAWIVADLVTVITTFTNSTTVGLRRRATQAVTGATCGISGHSAVYGTDDLAAWQAIVDAAAIGDTITLAARHLSLLGQGTLAITKPLNFVSADRTSGFHYGVTSGRIKAAAHGVTWRNVLTKGLQTNGVASTFAASTSGVKCRDWRFYDCKWDGVRANFERIGAMTVTGAPTTTGSDFDGPVTLVNAEMTGAMGEGALYVYGTNDVHAYNIWVHDNGQSINSGDQIKIAAGARGFHAFGGVTEWSARDGIDVYDAGAVVIVGLESRHNQVNGVEAKWISTSHYNATGRHSIKMRLWNNDTGANICTHYTHADLTTLGNRTYGVRFGPATDTNLLSEASVGLNVGPIIALGNGNIGVVLTNLKNLNADQIQAHGNGVAGIQALGNDLNLDNYQAFGNTTRGLEVVAGSTRVSLAGRSQDADGVAFVNPGSTGILRNGYGEEAGVAGNPPTAALWPSGARVKNTADGTMWQRTATGWDALGSGAASNPDTMGWGYPMTVDPNLGSTSTTFSANNTRYYRVKGAGVITKIGLELVVSAGNIAVAVYASSGVGRAAKPNGVPKGASGSVVCPAVGYAEIALGSSVTVVPGDWIALGTDSATTAFRSAGGGPAITALTDGASWTSSAFPPPSVTPTPVSSISGRLPVLVGVA